MYFPKCFKIIHYFYFMCFFVCNYVLFGACLVAQMVKNLPAMQETWVRSLGWEDPLEEVVATHSSIFTWGIPMDRGAWQPGRLQSMGSQRVGQD